MRGSGVGQAADAQEQARNVSDILELLRHRQPRQRCSRRAKITLGQSLKTARYSESLQ